LSLFAKEDNEVSFDEKQNSEEIKQTDVGEIEEVLRKKTGRRSEAFDFLLNK
jgi:hypothetical protein